MNHIGTQIIRTKRLVLRPFTLEDAEPMFRNWANDPEVTKYLTWPPHGSVDITRQVVESWISNYDKTDFYQWAIELDGEAIGSVSMVHQYEPVAEVELGYCLGRGWWHQGIMSEALSAVIRFFFEQVGANRVAALHDTRNPNSGAVMKKCGMVYEGTFRQYLKNNQGLCDMCCYSILKAEWKG